LIGSRSSAASASGAECKEAGVSKKAKHCYVPEKDNGKQTT